MDFIKIIIGDTPYAFANTFYVNKNLFGSITFIQKLEDGKTRIIGDRIGVDALVPYEVVLSSIESENTQEFVNILVLGGMDIDRLISIMTNKE